MKNKMSLPQGAFTVASGGKVGVEAYLGYHIKRPVHQLVGRVLADGALFEFVAGRAKGNIPRTLVNLLLPGAAMEDAVELVGKAVEEAGRAKQQLQEIANEVTKLRDFVNPLLMRHIEEIRNARMTLARESNDALRELREIRSFFLAADYSTEIERLERLLSACREIRQLKESGVLDAVCDIALRLAVEKSA